MTLKDEPQDSAEDLKKLSDQGYKVVQTEEEARQVLSDVIADNEQLAADPKARKLENQRKLNEALQQMERIWKTMTRKQKRASGVKVNSTFKYTDRLKKRLKSIELNQIQQTKQNAV